jgi:hypothetical protein
MTRVVAAAVHSPPGSVVTPRHGRITQAARGCHAGGTPSTDATPVAEGESMPRLATERAWYTPLLVVGAVALLIAVYAVLLWVVAARGG